MHAACSGDSAVFGQVFNAIQNRFEDKVGVSERAALTHKLAAHLRLLNIYHPCCDEDHRA